MMKRRLACVTLLAAAVAILGACSGIRTVSTEVSSFGEWAPDRRPGSYAFERLPSQQSRATEMEALETQARVGLAKAGFNPVESGQQPEVLVQVGARDSRALRDPWDDPFWWRGGFGTWGHGPWGAPRWGFYGRAGHFPRYEREVALLIRDRASGKPVFEAHATSEGNSHADGPTLAAMFEASMTDFPRLGVNPRRVEVIVGP